MPPSKAPLTANVIAKDFQVTGFREDTEKSHTLNLAAGSIQQIWNHDPAILHHRENVTSRSS